MLADICSAVISCAASVNSSRCCSLSEFEDFERDELRCEMTVNAASRTARPTCLCSYVCFSVCVCLVHLRDVLLQTSNHDKLSWFDVRTAKSRNKLLNLRKTYNRLQHTSHACCNSRHPGICSLFTKEFAFSCGRSVYEEVGLFM